MHWSIHQFSKKILFSITFVLSLREKRFMFNINTKNYLMKLLYSLNIKLWYLLVTIIIFKSYLVHKYTFINMWSYYVYYILWIYFFIIKIYDYSLFLSLHRVLHIPGWPWTYNWSEDYLNFWSNSLHLPRAGSADMNPSTRSLMY